MSDFSELCPLFQTGVFKEVTFPYIPMTGVTATLNALRGTITASHSGDFTFGRTVIVTGAFVKRVGATLEGQMILLLMHETSETATGTEFGSCVISNTGDGIDSRRWLNFTVATPKTFTSDEILGLSPATGTALSAGVYDLIVRYKEA